MDEEKLESLAGAIEALRVVDEVEEETSVPNNDHKDFQEMKDVLLKSIGKCTTRTRARARTPTHTHHAPHAHAPHTRTTRTTTTGASKKMTVIHSVKGKYSSLVFIVYECEPNDNLMTETQHKVNWSLLGVNCMTTCMRCQKQISKQSTTTTTKTATIVTTGKTEVAA